MPDIDELEKQLTELPRKQYSDLIRKVDAERRRAVENQANAPTNSMNKDEFAKWIVGQHFAVDKGIVRILYLPKDSRPEEVRLLEINELANIPEGVPVEPVDFMLDVADVNFSLLV